jgi:hypothetical protein
MTKAAFEEVYAIAEKAAVHWLSPTRYRLCYANATDFDVNDEPVNYLSNGLHKCASP